MDEQTPQGLGSELTEFDPHARKNLIQSQAQNFSISNPRSAADFDTAVDYLCAMLLFGTLWEAELIKNPALRRTLPGLQHMPLTCHTRECPYAAVCPVLKDMPEERWQELEGTQCRADVVYSTKLFTDQIQSLDIGPQHSNDIISVSNLVRYMLIQRRLDWELSLNGMTDKRVDAINPLTGEVHYKRPPSEILREMERVNKQIILIQNSLASTRRDRQAQNNTERSQANILTQLLAANRVRKAEVTSISSNTVMDSGQDSTIQDAEFKEIT